MTQNKVIKKRSLINVQPLHAASRLSELGLDPIKETVEKVREMELMLYTMRQMNRRSLVAETALYANITKAINSLLPYGYMTTSEAERHLKSLQDNGGLDDGIGGGVGINIFLTSADNPSMADKQSMAELPSDEGQNSQGYAKIEDSTDGVESIPTVSTRPEYIPGDDVHPELRGLSYKDRIDVEAGLAALQTDDGEIIEFAIKEGDNNIVQSIMAVQKSAVGVGGNRSGFTDGQGDSQEF